MDFDIREQVVLTFSVYILPWMKTFFQLDPATVSSFLSFYWEHVSPIKALYQWRASEWSRGEGEEEGRLASRCVVLSCVTPSSQRSCCAGELHLCTPQCLSPLRAPRSLQQPVNRKCLPLIYISSIIAGQSVLPSLCHHTQHTNVNTCSEVSLLSCLSCSVFLERLHAIC